MVVQPSDNKLRIPVNGKIQYGRPVTQYQRCTFPSVCVAGQISLCCCPVGAAEAACG